MSNEAKMNQMGAAIRRISSAVNNLGSKVNQLENQQDSEIPEMNFREVMVQKAEKITPYINILEITLANSTARTTQSLTISADGWFFIDRIYMSYRPTAGAQISRWRPMSSGHPSIASGELQAAGNVVGLLNFYWEYAEGRAQRTRQNLPIPGDILYRLDGDGVLAAGLGDGIGPNATVTFHITPTVAPGQAGVLVVSLVGVQCLGVLQQ